MKTLIINPPGEKGFDRSGRWPAKAMGGTFIEPLFLAYAAAVLEKEGMDVELIDCRPFYLSLEELFKKFDETVALVVLQTSTPSIDFDLNTAKQIKERFPKTKIALVGSHVSVLDKEIMENNEYIDFIVRGEYDYSVRDLVKVLIAGTEPSNIPGITFRKNKEIIRNESSPYIENLDELPFPARHFLPMHTYFDPMFKSKRTFRLTGSRGCPYRCTFCLWPQVMYGRKVRYRDPKKVVDEIEHLINSFEAKGLYFEDDTFTVNSQWVNELCDEILKREIKIPWSCLGRVDCVNAEMLKKMKKAGCYMIRYGVESASQEILDRVRKGITIEQIIKAFEMTQKIGMKIHSSYVFGLPGETKETIKQTIRFAIKLNSSYSQFVVAMPYPGTELYEEVKRNGWLRANKWSDFEPSEGSVLEYPNLKAEEIVEATKTAYFKFYFRPGYILKRLFGIRSASELYQLVNAAVILVAKLFKKQVSNAIR